MKVLVVEDDPDLRAMLVWTLEESYEVEVASHGEEAIEKLAGGPFGVVVVDIRLPGIDGLEVLQRFRRDRPEGRYLAITGYSSVEDIARAEGLGIGVLKKPFGVDEFLDEVQRLLE